MSRRAALVALAALLTAFAGAPVPPAAADPAAYVNTTDGTLGPGFPAVSAAVPFGMVQPGPDTSLPDGSQDPVNYTGYAYQDPSIRGFSLTHFDGAGIHIAGEMPFMPTTGTVGASDPAAYSSPYDHSSEVAQPGYYAVSLRRYGVRVQVSSTLRATIMRFTFPATAHANVLAEVTRAIDGTDSGRVSVVGDRELEGWVRSDVGYRLYFDAVFDRPFTGSGPLAGGGAYVTFDATDNRTVTMRVGVSYVDEAGAQGNLAAELPATRSFDQVRAAARADWDRHLDDVQVEGGTRAERSTFYDNLYRALLMPSVFDDADGRYLGFDGELHLVAPGHHHYTNLSLWDIYRSQLPLLGLIEPAVAHDVLASLIDDAQQNHGVIPRWVQANIDRGIMGGDSGSAALADGAAEGLLSAPQARTALSLLVTQATRLPPAWPREHLDAYVNYGYVPYDIDQIGASLTEEYAIDDDAVAQLAAALGDGADAAALQRRAGWWRNLIDPADRFIRPRNRDGSWADPTQLGDPTGLTGITTPITLPYSPDFQDGYQEGTGWQYLWSVPQDPAGLARAIGGRAIAIRRLDRFFTSALNTPLAPAVPLAQQQLGFFGVYYIGNQYTSVNEPDLWAPWFYDFYGQPWKTQKVARAEMQVYNQTPEGLPGNDDAGELSAWYVLAALGLYHVAPGVDAWELSSPVFPRSTVRAAGRRLVLDAPGANEARPYVHGLALNGRAVNRSYLTSCELRGGGQLRFWLGATPDRSWASGVAAAPPSDSAPAAIVTACAARLVEGG